MTPDNTQSPITRRKFAKGMMATMAAPFLLPSLGKAAETPLPTFSVFPKRVRKSKTKPNLAWIGLGGQGLSNLYNFVDAANVVALCDVDLRKEGRAQVRYNGKHYDFVTGASLLCPGAAIYQDFRKMLIEMGDKIDAVGVSTHDRNHFPAAYMAMNMGKHVFVQKPLCHSVWECQTLQHLAERKGLVTQMGIQGHGFEGIRLIREWYLAGLVGDVREVYCWTNRPAEGYGFRNIHSTSFPPVVPVPRGLDWDLWLGPSEQEVGFSTDLDPAVWRAWWEFGCGGLGDIGCHTIDSPFWTLDLGAPTRISAQVEGLPPLCTPNGSIVTYEFPARNGRPPVTLKWFEGPMRPMKPKIMGNVEMPIDGMIMLGDKGAIFHRGMRPNSPQLLPESKWEEFRANPAVRPPKILPRVRSIFDDWINAVSTGARTCANFDYSAPLAQVAVLGTLAIRTGKPIEWDPETMTVLNDNPEAARLVKVAARPGWRVEDLNPSSAARFIKT